MLTGGQCPLPHLMGFLLLLKMIGDANILKFLDMKIVEIVKINRELLKNLHTAGVRIEDAKYIDLYADYRRMLANGDKVSYIVTVLSNKYAVSERKVYGLIKHFQSDCKLFAV